MIYTLPKIGIQDLDIELDEAVYYVNRHNKEIEDMKS